MSDEAVPEFSWPTRVYWEDTDGGGVVYHANYLRFLERARTEWLRSRGLEQRQLLNDQRVQFVLFEVRLRFVRPARLDDELNVSVRLTDCRRASFTVEQSVTEASTGTELCCAKVEVACLDADRFRPRAMPAELRAVIGSPG